MIVARRTSRILRLLALALTALFNNAVEAQERIFPMDAGLSPPGVFDTGQPRPGYRTATADPRFKTRVTRITDRDATPKGDAGTSPVAIIHHYSRLPAWNKDGSLLIVGSSYLLDGKTYEKKGTYSEYSAETFWSNLDASTMWAFRPRLYSNDNPPVLLQEPALMKVKLSNETGQWREKSVATIGPFPQNHPEFPNDEMYAGLGEGRITEDDRLLALVARRGTDLHVYVLDTSNGRRVAHASFPGGWRAGSAPDLDWATMSPTGKYLLLGWRIQAGRGGVVAYDFTLTPNVDKDFTGVTPRTITAQTAHGDVCRRRNALGGKGEEVWVQMLYAPLEAQFGGDLAAFYLNPSITPRYLLMLPNGAIGDFSGHVSCTNFGRPGWAYVSGYQDPIYANASPFEAFAIEIRDNAGVSGRIPVQSFANHNSNAFVPDDAGTFNYASQPHAVADPSGYRVMFASNWFATNTNSDIYSYVAERPNPVNIRSSTPTGVTISSALVQFELSRLQWQALTLTTPKGTSLPVTDLLFYQTSVVDAVAEDLPGDYWLDPAKPISVTYQKLSPLGSAETAVVRATRKGLTKTAYVTVYPEDPLVYVVVRLTTTRQFSRLNDNQLTWFSNTAGDSLYASKVLVDGTDYRRVQPPQSAFGARYGFLYFPVKDASLAVMLAPASLQKVKAGQLPVFFQHMGTNGSNLALHGLDYESFGPSETIEYRYVIYWNDGDREADVRPLADAIRSGAYNAKFRTQ